MNYLDVHNSYCAKEVAKIHETSSIFQEFNFLIIHGVIVKILLSCHHFLQWVTIIYLCFYLLWNLWKTIFSSFFGSLAKNSQPGAKELKIWFGRENRHQDTRIDGLFREQGNCLCVWKSSNSPAKGELKDSTLITSK